MKTKKADKLRSGSDAPDSPGIRTLIEVRAYHIWREEGGSGDDSLKHWLRAEQEIRTLARMERDQI